MLIDVIRNVFADRQRNHRDIEHYLHGTYIPAYCFAVKTDTVSLEPFTHTFTSSIEFISFKFLKNF